MKPVSTAMAAILLFAGSAQASENRQDVGDWSVIERTDDVGNLTCILTRENGDPRLQMAAGGQEAFDGRVRLSFSTPITDGERGSIPDAGFDIDGKSWTVGARWVALNNGTYLTAPLGETQSDVLLLLSKGHKLTASFLGNTFAVDLKGSQAAIKIYFECLRKAQLL